MKTLEPLGLNRTLLLSNQLVCFPPRPRTDASRGERVERRSTRSQTNKLPPPPPPLSELINRCRVPLSDKPGLPCQRAAGSPNAHTLCERKYARLLLAHHLLSVSLAEERVCVLTLVEGRCEDREVWQRDGSFLGMKEAGLVRS